MSGSEIEAILRRNIAEKQLSDFEGRGRLYKSARKAAARRNDEAFTQRLELAISAIEQSFEPKRQFSIRMPLILLATLLLGIAAGSAATMMIVKPTSLTSGKADMATKLMITYHEQKALLPVADRFLQKIVDAIIERQRSDRKSLGASSKSFIGLAKFDPKLNSELPKSLPPETNVVLRADTQDFKILMNWPLCGIAKLSAQKW